MRDAKAIMPAIAVNNLTKIFSIKQKSPGLWGGLRSLARPRYKDVTAVDHLSLTVDEGELLAFIGPNGAGKSTTIKMLIGILYPTDGTIHVLGFDPARDRRKLAYHVGSVFGQKPQLWYHLPPRDTYDLLAKIYELDGAAYHERLKFLIDAFEIERLLGTPVRKLSLGERMRCEVVASLLHRPKIIFLDEPTIGLDVIAKQRIREVIKLLNEKERVTIFLTSHDAGDVETLAKRTVVINHGAAIFDGLTSDLKKRYLRTKVIELIAGKPIGDFAVPDGHVVEKTRYSMKIEIDPTRHDIGKLLAKMVDRLVIQDINIYDPPMEEIIAAIYREQRS